MIVLKKYFDALQGCTLYVFCLQIRQYCKRNAVIFGIFHWSFSFAKMEAAKIENL